MRAIHPAAFIVAAAFLGAVGCGALGADSTRPGISQGGSRIVEPSVDQTKKGEEVDTPEGVPRAFSACGVVLRQCVTSANLAHTKAGKGRISDDEFKERIQGCNTSFVQCQSGSGVTAQ